MKCTYIIGANSEIAKELINEELKKNEALYLFTSKKRACVGPGHTIGRAGGL